MAVTDEALYRRYLDGDESGLDRLVEKYGDPLTLYIDGYLHDIHEAEERMMDVFAYLFVKRPGIRDGGLKAYLYKGPCGASGGAGRSSAWRTWTASRTAGRWWRRSWESGSGTGSCTCAWRSCGRSTGRRCI